MIGFYRVATKAPEGWRSPRRWRAMSCVRRRRKKGPRISRMTRILGRGLELMSLRRSWEIKGNGLATKMSPLTELVAGALGPWKFSWVVGFYRVAAKAPEGWRSPRRWRARHAFGEMRHVWEREGGTAPSGLVQVSGVWITISN